MKDSIDHVLPWIKSDIFGEKLAYLVHRETKMPLWMVTEKLKQRGRYFAPPERRNIVRDVAHLRSYRGRIG